MWCRCSLRKTVELSANSGEPDQMTCSAHLIWVCTVCQLPVKGSPVFNRLMYSQWRLKSACTSAQANQSLLSAWRNFASLAIQKMPSEDSDQTAGMHFWRYIADPDLTLKRLSKILANILIFLNIIFRENKVWQFMWIICLADDSHEISSLIFSKKNYQIIICCNCE